MNVKKKWELTATQVILLGFLGAIIFGSLLLMCPFASAEGTFTDYEDALFTAATSVCVTGLTVVDTYAHWSLAGKIIILILIQLGGLGIISFTSGFMMLFHRRISLRGNILLGNAFNLDTLDGLKPFLRKVFLGTFLVEGIGAFLCMPVFIPDFGARGIWIAFFHSVSAFCNAGIDIIGPDSLIPYADNIWLNLVTMLLIILGGLGFIVWWDILAIGKRIRTKRLRRAQFFTSLSLHSKITLIATAVLIAGGALAFILIEWNNGLTMGEHAPWAKILIGFFQSVTLRTAGFATIPQAGLRDASVMVCVVLMFIGGSSVGTAGGVKTSTVALLVLSAFTVIKGGENVSTHGRTLPHRLVQRAIAIIVIAIGALITMTIILSLVQGGALSDVLYETASALGTAGLTRGLCAQLNVPAKYLIILCMYLGRVGPISLATAFAYRENADNIHYPKRDITIG